jgi:hypothetical protein
MAMIHYATESMAYMVSGTMDRHDGNILFSVDHCVLSTAKLADAVK